MPNAAPAARGVYKLRRPQAPPLLRLVSDHLHRRHTVCDDRLVREDGPWRPVVAPVTKKFLACGVLEHGFARIRCDVCMHEYLLVADHLERFEVEAAGARAAVQDHRCRTAYTIGPPRAAWPRHCPTRATLATNRRLQSRPARSPSFSAPASRVGRASPWRWPDPRAAAVLRSRGGPRSLAASRLRPANVQGAPTDVPRDECA